MTKEQEALNLALEVLEDWDSPLALPAIVAIEAALAQPEQEPSLQEQLDKAVADMDKAKDDVEKAYAVWDKACDDWDKAHAEIHRIEALIREAKAND
jgi:hypothetical protein